MVEATSWKTWSAAAGRWSVQVWPVAMPSSLLLRPPIMTIAIWLLCDGGGTGIYRQECDAIPSAISRCIEFSCLFVLLRMNCHWGISAMLVEVCSLRRLSSSSFFWKNSWLRKPCINIALTYWLTEVPTSGFLSFFYSWARLVFPFLSCSAIIAS